MRRGFSLIELLIVIMTLPVIAWAADRAFRQMTVDVPKGIAMVTRYDRLQRIVEAIREDVDRAISLSLDPSQDAEGSSTLVIQQVDAEIRYVPFPGGVQRETRNRQVDPNTSATRAWYLEQSNLSWRLWPRENETQVLHLETSMTHSRHNEKRSFENSHLFFAGAGLIQGGRNETP